ncbi:hypothetical protein GCM10009067_25050 [Haloarcula sebkhae]|uniref:Uncharacterized protein n=1 Tax=Haloarcula sebkhae TaxID=932660 RepID=A0A830F3H9_9EURY|nr:hypothetical protein GCM10009067_25050 [Haloarcula sebkhae]
MRLFRLALATGIDYAEEFAPVFLVFTFWELAAEGVKLSGRDYCMHQVNNDAFVGRYVRRFSPFYFGERRRTTSSQTAGRGRGRRRSYTA